MDFAKQLMNLQQSADRARNQNNSNGSRSNNNNDRDRHHRDHPSRHDYNRNSNRRGDNNRYQPYNRRGRGGHNYQNRRNQGMSDAEEDYYLPKLVQAIPKYQPIPTKKKDKQRHICILFLTIDDLPFEHIWKEFFKGNNSDLMVSVICHAKFPDKVQSDWLRKRLLVQKPKLSDMEFYKKRYQQGRQDGHEQDQDSHLLPPIRYRSRKPEWGSVEITRAMVDLLEESLQIGTSRQNIHIKDAKQEKEYKKQYSSWRYVVSDGMHKDEDIVVTDQPLPTVDRFIFASESCIPVTTLDELEKTLFKEESSDDKEKIAADTFSSAETKADENPYDGRYANKSWVNARNTPNNGYARQLQWDATHQAIPTEHIWKADQWIMLTRHDAWPIVSLIDDAVQTLQDSERNNRSHNDNRNNPTLQLGFWQCFRRVKASDEMYFPTVMSLLGILGKDKDKSSSGQDDDKNDEKSHSIVHRKRVTYCDWSMNAKNPAAFEMDRKNNFKELRDVVKAARKEGCIFARKFTISPNGPVQEDADYKKGEELITGEEWSTLIRKMKQL